MANELIVVTSSFGSARIKKRILKLRKEARIIKLYTFQRDNEMMEIKNDVLDIVDEHYCVGEIKDGKIFTRIWYYLKLIKVLGLPLNKKRNYYIFGSDLTFIILFIKGRIILEVADLRVIDTKSLFKSFLKLLDRIALSKVSKLILTSEHHYSSYYKKYISNDKVMILRNKLPKTSLLTSLSVNPVVIDNKINIGLFGVLRFERIIDMLILLVKENQQKYNLIIYGKPSGKYNSDHLSSLDAQNNNIFWKGMYNHPEDLSKIYSEIDINFVVYDIAYQNVRIAIPNKLYESVFFKRPILCSTQTAFGQEINKLKIGKTIRTESFAAFSEDILSFGPREIETTSLKMSEIDQSYYFDMDYKLLS